MHSAGVLRQPNVPWAPVSDDHEAAAMVEDSLLRECFGAGGKFDVDLWAVELVSDRTLNV